MNKTRSLASVWKRTRAARIVLAVTLAVILSWAWGVGGSAKADAAPAPASVSAQVPTCHMGVGGTWQPAGCYGAYARAGAAQPTENWRTAGKCAGVGAIGFVGGPLGASGAFGSCLWLSLW